MMEDSNFATGYAVGRDSNGGYGNGMFGNDWAWIIILLLFGYGRNGFGGFGGGFGAPCATQADVRAAVDQQTLISKIDEQTYGMANSFTALNGAVTNGFYGVQSALCQGFNGVNAQIADCCCATQGAIKDVGYNIEKTSMQNRFDAQAYNCNTLQAIDKVGDRIIDYLANEKAQALRDENFALRLSASQLAQNEALLNKLSPCPTPAYFVPNPNCCYNANVTYSNACGCGGF